MPCHLEDAMNRLGNLNAPAKDRHEPATGTIAPSPGYSPVPLVESSLIRSAKASSGWSKASASDSNTTSGATTNMAGPSPMYTSRMAPS
jgi:hypothetical protein